MLTDDPYGNINYYREIVIGAYGNTRSEILGLGNVTLGSVATPGILQCDDFIQFWITWQTEALTVTQNQQNSVPFLKHIEVDRPPIHAVLISTGDGNSGEWQFGQDIGKHELILHLRQLSGVICHSVRLGL